MACQNKKATEAMRNKKKKTPGTKLADHHVTSKIQSLVGHAAPWKKRDTLAWSEPAQPPSGNTIASPPWPAPGHYAVEPVNFLWQVFMPCRGCICGICLCSRAGEARTRGLERGGRCESGAESTRCHSTTAEEPGSHRWLSRP